mmetsp:Transcript_27891/g.45272  ORF Transcript_27891/g.45272 Transcript_27891/m.45272 type:complete len:261 (-) Transcript_27891:209-991(-)
MSHQPVDASDQALPVLPPALPEPVPGVHQVVHELHNPHFSDDVHAAVAAAVDNNPHPLGGDQDECIKVEEGGVAAAASATTPKKRRRKLLLTFHEALTFASRGIYVDIDTNQLRCSCNHKPCDKWDAYGYTRHFEFKCHKKYEEERLDDAEINRLREAKATFLRMNPQVEEQSIRKKRKMKEGEKILSVDELRVQERHWMEMWKDSKNELKQLRQDLKVEVDEEVRAELMADIEGLKKRKGDWARLLGLNETIADIPVTF